MSGTEQTDPYAGERELARIRALSRPFRLLFAGLFALVLAATVIGAGAVLFYDGPYIRVSADLMETGSGQLLLTNEAERTMDDATMPVAALPLSVRLLAVLNVGVLQFGTLCLVLWHLQGLFALYDRGIVFTRANAARLRHLGLWLALWGIAPALGHQLALLSGLNDTTWFRLSSVAGVITGGVVFVIASVMDLGSRIETERSEFV